MALVAGDQFQTALGAGITRRDGQHALVGGFGVRILRSGTQTIRLGDQQLCCFFLAALQFQAVGGIAWVLLDRLLEFANAGLVLSSLYLAHAFIMDATAGASGQQYGGASHYRQTTKDSQGKGITNVHWGLPTDIH